MWRYTSTLSLILGLDGGWSTPRLGRFTPGKLGAHFIAGWVSPRKCAENLASIGIQSPDLSGRSQSLYRYPELYSFLTNDTRRGEGSASRAGHSLPPGKSRYSLYRRLGGPQGRSGQVRKISPPSGFDLRTFQPVASRYTDTRSSTLS